MTSLPTALKKPKHSPPLPQEPPPAASSLSLRVSRTFWAARQTLSQSCAQRPQHSANPARVGGGHRIFDWCVQTPPFSCLTTAAPPQRPGPLAAGGVPAFTATAAAITARSWGERQRGALLNECTPAAPSLLLHIPKGETEEGRKAGRGCRHFWGDGGT